MNFLTSILTNQGGRDNNEDYAAYICRDGYGAWIAADGLGGHQAGEVASKLAADTALSRFESNPTISKQEIEEVVNAANMAVVAGQAADFKHSGMRTTIVGLFSNGDKTIWAHVGDSRLYWFRDGRLIGQTRDHSVSQAAVASGEITADQIRFHDDRNKLLRVLGTGPELKIEITEPSAPIMQGDAFLLCTDGFWEYIYELEMEIDLAKSATPDEWLKYMSGRLYGRLGKDNDNFTALAVFCTYEGDER